ncbi:MAG: lamin tail domain-containing protein [Candidatus Schekmanbacteria bacterium]|nr:lamin tail domain-containing protein [Candidatus Schekmanbacteria bacterium]
MKKCNFGFICCAVLSFVCLITLTSVSVASPINISDGIEISELMYDHPVSDTGGEWIEIYNGTGNILNLSRLMFSDNGGASYKSIIQLSGYADIHSIPDGTFAVISEPAGAVSFSSLYTDSSIYAGVTSSAMSLLNTGEEISLIDSIDGIAGNGNDILLQDFIFPDIAINNSIYKLFITSSDETLLSSFAASAISPWGTGFGNPGKLNNGQQICVNPVPEPSSGLLFPAGLAMVFLSYRFRKS